MAERPKFEIIGKIYVIFMNKNISFSGFLVKAAKSTFVIIFQKINTKIDF